MITSRIVAVPIFILMIIFASFLELYSNFSEECWDIEFIFWKCSFYGIPSLLYLGIITLFSISACMALWHDIKILRRFWKVRKGHFEVLGTKLNQVSVVWWDSLDQYSKYRIKYSFYLNGIEYLTSVETYDKNRFSDSEIVLVAGLDHRFSVLKKDLESYSELL